MSKVFERWPGYAEQSWAQRFAELDRRQERLTRALNKLTAENKRLQQIINARPAINAGLPETYIEWSQNLYLLDAIRSAGAHEI